MCLWKGMNFIMDGLYELSAKTPMGVIKGILKLITNGNNLSGYIEVMGNKNEFCNGIVNGNKFMMSGNIKTTFKNINYSVQGELVNNNINILAKTNMGSFSLQGRKIS